MQIYTEGFGEGNMMIILMIVAYLIIGTIVALKMGSKMIDSESDDGLKGIVFLLCVFLWPLGALGALVAVLGNFVYGGKS